MQEKNQNKAELLRKVALFLGPILALALYQLLPEASVEAKVPGLSPEGRATASIAFLMALWWISEALPLAITALLPLVLFPLFQVTSIEKTSAPYADKVIFLFMGGFMLGTAMTKWNLHRRFALFIIHFIGTQPLRVIAGFMIATAFLSMWVSNTATVVMMLPIGISIIDLVLSKMKSEGDSQSGKNFAICLMLGIAYAGSIGGLGTLIGSPPNALFAAFVSQQYGVTITFRTWLILGLPLVIIFLPLTWFLLTHILFPIRIKNIPGGKKIIEKEIQNLGKLRQPEMVILFTFCLVSFLWVFRPQLAFIPFFSHLNDTAIALIGITLLFICPVKGRSNERVLDWQTAVKIPWEILLLFGGGLSLASAMTDTGVAAFIGSQLGLIKNLHPVLIMMFLTTIVVFLTEITSNTAIIATFLPILAAVALTTGTEPIFLLLPATLCSSLAFMLPVATPPNAIVFSSGQVNIRQMCRAGIWLNLLGILLVSLWVYIYIKLGL